MYLFRSNGVRRHPCTLGLQNLSILDYVSGKFSPRCVLIQVSSLCDIWIMQVAHRTKEHHKPSLSASLHYRAKKILFVRVIKLVLVFLVLCALLYCTASGITNYKITVLKAQNEVNSVSLCFCV